MAIGHLGVGHKCGTLYNAILLVVSRSSTGGPGTVFLQGRIGQVLQLLANEGVASVQLLERLFLLLLLLADVLEARGLPSERAIR